MPQTKQNKNDRKTIRIPAAMIGEIDRLIVAFKELKYNRQQFIESALREKIEKMKLLEAESVKKD